MKRKIWVVKACIRNPRLKYVLKLDAYTECVEVECVFRVSGSQTWRYLEVGGEIVEKRNA